MSKKKSKSKPPVGKRILQLLCGFLPFVLYLSLTVFLFPAPSSGFLLPGFAGAAIFGVALAFLLETDRKTHSSVFKLLCAGFSVGTILIGAGSVLVYVPRIYSSFRGEFVDYYMALWAFMTIPGIFYALFRAALFEALRDAGMSRSAVKKAMKGRANYWWYEQLHAEQRVGRLYALNKLFTLTFPASVLLHLLLGWLSLLSLPISILFALSCALCSALWAFAGTRAEKQHVRSEIQRIVGMLFPLCAAVSALILSCRI